jgi:outer membrane protein assembly factor BamB
LGFDPGTQDPADQSPDWRSSGHDWSNTGYNAAESAISPGTVENLTVSWESTDAFVSGTPIISEGTVYLADAFGVVSAHDAATGAELFYDQLTLTLGPSVTVGQFITALSVADGRLYVAHGVPIPGLHPGGVTVYALPPGAESPRRSPDSGASLNSGQTLPVMRHAASLAGEFSCAPARLGAPD